MIRQFARTIVRYAPIILIVAALMTGGALFVFSSLTFDTSVDVFFDKTSEAYLQFQSWKEQFGSDQVIIVAFSAPDIFTPENLSVIAAVTDRVERLHYVDSVRSITNVNDVIGAQSDFIVQPFIEEVPQDAGDLKRLREAALSNPLYVKDIISEDGHVAALIVELEPVGEELPEAKQQTVQSVTMILEQVVPPGLHYYVSGLTAIEYYYAWYMQQDFKNFIPLIFIVIVIILLLSFRSLVSACLPLVAVVMSVIWTLACLVLFGFSVNNVTTIVAPIMLAIAIADSIHFVTQCLQVQKHHRYELVQEAHIIEETITHLFTPCLLTTLTTAAGFFSLLVSTIEPVRQLGLVVGIGVLLAFIITFTVLPALLKQLHLLRLMVSRNRSAMCASRSYAEGALQKISFISQRYHRLILWLTLLVVIGSVMGMSHIKTETSVLEYFKARSPIYHDTRFIEEHLSGVHFVNVSLRTDKRDYFRSPRVLHAIDSLQAYLKTLPEVDKTTSVVDYIKEIHKSFHNERDRYYTIPDTRQLISQYLLLYGATDMRDYVNEEWNWTTVRIRLNEHSTVRLQSVIDRINTYVHTHFRDIDTSVLGQTVLEVNSNEAVTKGQMRSLVVAMVVIFIMMFIVFRSVPMGCISIIPNALPLLINFGIMGMTSIRLNSATSMIAAIGIGIIVDDTIHFLHRLKIGLATGKDIAVVVDDTIMDKGRPIIVTSIILAFGFSVVATSRFVPTMFFGVLSALLMINALWADLIVLPSILLTWYGRSIGRVKEKA